MGVIKNEHEQREYHEWINLAFVIFELFVFVIKSNWYYCTDFYSKGVHLSPLGFAACQSKKCTNKA